MANNATIVAASLSDEDLRNSIDKLVQHVDKQALKMAENFDAAVSLMKESLRSLNNAKVSFGDITDKAAARRSTAQSEAIKETNAQIDANKKLKTSFDDIANAQGKAVGRKRGIEYMEMPSDVDKSLTYLVNVNKDVDAQMEKILQKEQELIAAKQREAQVSREIAEAQARQTRGLSGKELGYGTVHEMQEAANRNRYKVAAAGMESYEGMLMRVLGLQSREIQNVNEETDSYKRLNAKLKELREAYNRLDASERNSDNGKHLVGSMQEIQRAIQKIQAQASRPVNLKSALGLEEKTLDDIAYKIRRLSEYRSGIDITKVGAKLEIEKVNNAIDVLKKKQNELLSSNKTLLESNNALARSWNYMKNRLAFYFTVGASTQFVRNLIEVRSQYEMNERALGILINSAERGSKIFQELSQMALVSPYTLIELSAAAKQLTAYDIAAKDVVDTTRRLADMAAAVGIPIERLTYALGQIKAYGYLNSRDARMFANAGIPLVKQLSDYYTQLEGKLVSTADVYDRMKKKAIDYSDVMQVINKMTDEGGKFFDFQAKMAETLKVQLANLTLAWNNMLNDIGASNQGLLYTSINLAKQLFLHWKNIESLFNDIALTFVFVKLMQAIQIANIGLTAFGKRMAWNILIGKRLTNVLFSLASSIKAIVTSPVTWWALLAVMVTSATVAIWNMNEAQKALNKSLRDGAKEGYDNISKFLEQYNNVRQSLYKTEVDPKTGAEERIGVEIQSGEAKKAWEAIREQIESSSHASDEYIGRLLEIENISERVRRGFDVLDEIREVSAAIKELGDDAIKTDTNWSDWWNAWVLPDSMVENLKDYQEELNNLREKYENAETLYDKWREKLTNRERMEVVGGNAEMEIALSNFGKALGLFRQDLSITTQSVIDFLELKGWSRDNNKIDEVFKHVEDKLVQENQLDPQQVFILQQELEIQKAAIAKKALEERIEDEKAALSVANSEIARMEIESRIEASEEELRNFYEYNGRSKAYWNDFTRWLKEQHISETTEMFRGMDAEQIKSLNFQEGKYGEWVTRMVEKYAKEHKMSYDDTFKYLKSWIQNANKWSIFIPLTIGTEGGKSVYESLKEEDANVDDALARLERLRTRRNELQRQGAALQNGTEEGKEYLKVVDEITAAERDLEDARAKGGHGKDSKRKGSGGGNKKDPLAEALQKEISLVKELQGAYDKLTKAGATNMQALATIRQSYGSTIAMLNATLRSAGLRGLNLDLIKGKNPHDMLAYFEEIKSTLEEKGLGNLKRMELVEGVIKTLRVDVQTFDLKKITDGLNSELSKLKEEYELSVELSADSDLGNMFAEYFGIDRSSLPSSLEDAIRYAQELVDNAIQEAVKLDPRAIMEPFDVLHGDIKAWAESMGRKTNDELVKGIENVQKYVKDLRIKDIRETNANWQKMLEKYAEYEYKRKKITEEYEKEIALARKKGASEDIIQAITNRRDSELAKLDFEEFQKSAYWVTATGDLANLSRDAIGMLIERLEAYKKSAKNLDTKQIKQLNKALSNLYKEQRKNNPFRAIGDMMQQARERMMDYEQDIADVEAEITRLQDKRADGTITDEEEEALEKAIKKWQELKDAQKKAGEIDATQWVEAINATVAAVKTAVAVFDDLAKAIGGVKDSDVDKVFSVIEKGGQGAAMGAQIGGGWGALVGGVLGAASGLIEILANADNERINKEIEESERAVKRLELAYVDLQHAIDNAYGTGVVGAKRAMAAAKELELAELERQLRLEQSRKAKDRDDDKILDLQKQIKELRYEIRDSITEITNDLLGSDVSSFAENLVTSMIDAFKQGEDYMKVFEESFDKMIDNLIMKSIVSKIITEYLNNVWDNMDERIKQRTNTEANAWAKAQQEYERLQSMTYGDWLQANAGEVFYDTMNGNLQRWSEARFEAEKKAAETAERNAREAYEAASQYTDDDIKTVINELAEMKPELAERLKELIGSWYTFGQSGNEELSALQQGIQGITEDTAGAIEAYLNIVSQRVFEHGNILMEIRDAVVGFDMDVQVATMSQILLQLQASYQAQMAIQNMLSGTLNPSGRAFMVEMV